MRTLHIIVSLNIGGAENMLKSLIESDSTSIPNTIVVSLSTMGSIGVSLQNIGVKVYALHLLPTGFNIISVTWKLIKLIRNFQPDIVQTWMYHADFLGGVAAYLAGYKNIVWGIRTLSLNDSSRTTVLIMKICATLSTLIPKKIICNAVSSKEAHIAAGYNASGMLVIPNGFNFTKLRATKAQRTALRLACHFAEDTLVIGSVGRFHADKGQDIFIKASAIVLKRYPFVRFLLVGRDCDINNSKLLDLLSSFDLIEKFVLLGERTDIPVCLAAMDIYCMPSRTEAFPNGLGEAMAMSLPCVATEVGDTAFLVGNTAILISSQNELALAESLLHVVSLPEKRRLQMGQAAKERVINEFSMEKAHRHFSDVYHHILRNTKGDIQ